MATIQVDARPTHIGGREVDYIHARGILTRASGYASHFDYTLNPYTGCTFGCAYCYAASFVRDDALKARWGDWVQVKANALDLLARRRARPLLDKTVYMSSVTDPYQPVEARLGLTRALLEELLACHRVRLVVQTRSPLVTRHLDLLREFEYVQVNMTVTTDDDSVRRVFEPSCSSIDRRLEAITAARAAGLPTGVTMTPLLPVRDAQGFARRLQSTGARRFAIQAFHPDSGRFASSTPDDARRLSATMGWDFRRYEATRRVLAAALPNLVEGRDGFIPWWATESKVAEATQPPLL